RRGRVRRNAVRPQLPARHDGRGRGAGASAHGRPPVRPERRRRARVGPPRRGRPSEPGTACGRGAGRLMVLALPIVIGVALALVCGGRLGGLATMKLRHVELFYVAIAIQVVAFPASFLPWEMSDGVARVLWLLSYGVLCVAALINFRVTGVLVVAAGM